MADKSAGILYYNCDRCGKEHGVKMNRSGGTNIGHIASGTSVSDITFAAPFTPYPAQCPITITVNNGVIGGI